MFWETLAADRCPEVGERVRCFYHANRARLSACAPTSMADVPVHDWYSSPDGFVVTRVEAYDGYGQMSVFGDPALCCLAWIWTPGFPVEVWQVARPRLGGSDNGHALRPAQMAPNRRCSL